MVAKGRGCCGNDEDKAKRVATCEEAVAIGKQGGNYIADKSRCITDIIPLLVFLGFLFGMVYVGILAVDEGKVARVQYGMDYKGNACGDGDRSSYEHQYWPNVLFYKQLGSVCLSDCPDTAASWSASDWGTTVESICVCSATVASGNTATSGSGAESYSVSDSLNTNAAASTLGQLCSQSPWKELGYYKASISTSAQNTGNDYTKYFSEPSQASFYSSGTKINVPLCNPTYRTQKVMNRCIPWIDYNSMSALFCYTGWGTNLCPEDKISEHFEGIVAWFEEGVADLVTCQWVLVASVGIALVVGFLYLFFMKYCARCVLWVGLLGTIAGTGLCCFAFYDEYANLKDRVDVEPELATHDEDQRNMYICLGFMIFFGLLCTIVTCVVVCFCKQIDVAARLLGSAADAMLDMPMLVFYPLGQVLFLLIWFVVFVGGSLLLVSAGDVVYDSTYGYAELDHDSTLERAFAFWLFGFLWLCEMTSAVGFMVVAFCFAMWFFSPIDPENKSKRQMHPSPICTSIRLTLCYHMGTCAFGSLIIAVITFIKLVVEYLEKKKEEAEKAGIPCMCMWDFVFCCCRCCLWCLECCMRFINKVAYILTVIKGSNFVSSACSAVGMILGNMSWISVVSAISSCMLMFGKLASALVVAAICGYWAAELQVSSILFPVLVTFFIGFAIAMLFAEVYEMAVDTMLICYLYARDYNDGHPQDGIPVPKNFDDIASEFGDNTDKKEEIQMEKTGAQHMRDSEVTPAA